GCVAGISFDVSSVSLFARQILTQRRRDVAHAPIDADLPRDANQCGSEQRMFSDRYRLAIDQASFHLLGDNGGSSETADQLLKRFGALGSAGLIGEDRGNNVLVAASDR